MKSKVRYLMTQRQLNIIPLTGLNSYQVMEWGLSRAGEARLLYPWLAERNNYNCPGPGPVKFPAQNTETKGKQKGRFLLYHQDTQLRVDS